MILYIIKQAAKENVIVLVIQLQVLLIVKIVKMVFIIYKDFAINVIQILQGVRIVLMMKKLKEGFLLLNVLNV